MNSDHDAPETIWADGEAGIRRPARAQGGLAAGRAGARRDPDLRGDHHPARAPDRQARRDREAANGLRCLSARSRRRRRADRRLFALGRCVHAPLRAARFPLGGFEHGGVHPDVRHRPGRHHPVRRGSHQQADRGARAVGAGRHPRPAGGVAARRPSELQGRNRRRHLPRRTRAVRRGHHHAGCIRRRAPRKAALRDSRPQDRPRHARRMGVGPEAEQCPLVFARHGRLGGICHQEP